MSKLGNAQSFSANSFADAWDKAPFNRICFCDISGTSDSPNGSNKWFCQLFKASNIYGWQVAWSFTGSIYKRERNNSNTWTDWSNSATKSDLACADITPTPISGLAFAPATMFKKAGVAYLNLQISNTTSSVISMENGKVIATGLPIPYKKQQVYVEAIPWNNGTTGSNASTTPLRLCINNTGQLCSYYPSANEKITPGMPICINMAYPINE